MASKKTDVNRSSASTRRILPQDQPSELIRTGEGELIDCGGETVLRVPYYRYLSMGGPGTCVNLTPDLYDIEARVIALEATPPGGVTDHGALTGLGDDDHAQYLLVAGTRAMTGDLDMGSNGITNVGNVDGVDVSAHAARHISGGADEIDGDQLDIDWNPSNYTPSTVPTEATSVDHLTAHLYGIDQALVGGGGASTELDNLSSPTMINESLISDTNNTDDLGSDLIEWKDVWAHRLAHNDTTNPDLTIETTGNNGSVRINSIGTGDIDLHTSNDLIIELGDAAGANVIDVQDSTATSVVQINSDGEYIGAGNVSNSLNNNGDLGSEPVEWKDVWAHRLAHGDASNPDLTVQTTSNNGSIRLTTHGTGEIDLHSGADVLLELGDAAGANKVSVLDSAAAEVLAIDSNGNVTLSGTVDTRDVAADGSKLDKITHFKGITVESPSGTENISIIRTSVAITITRIDDVIQGSTSVDWNIQHATTRNNGTPNSLFSIDRTTSSNSGASTTSFNDATIPAGSYIWLTTSAISGTPDELHITFTFTFD